MRLEDMLLVVCNDKGREYKYLSSIEDYLAILFKTFEGQEGEIAHAVKEIYNTKENGLWTEIYPAADRTYYARFCGNDYELRCFLKGLHKMAEGVAGFDRKQCSEECMEVLRAYGMDCEGRARIGSLHYEQQERSFRQGETLHNMGGGDYSVLWVLREDILFLMAHGSGQFVIADGVKEYVRYPREGDYPSDSVVRGIEWDGGTYLGNDLSVIDIDEIRKSYAAEKDVGEDEIHTDGEER